MIFNDILKLDEDYCDLLKIPCYMENDDYDKDTKEADSTINTDDLHVFCIGFTKCISDLSLRKRKWLINMFNRCTSNLLDLNKDMYTIFDFSNKININRYRDHNTECLYMYKGVRKRKKVHSSSLWMYVHKDTRVTGTYEEIKNITDKYDKCYIIGHHDCIHTNINGIPVLKLKKVTNKNNENL